MICAGEAVEKYDGKSFAPFLRRCANRRMLLVGLGTGTWILAAAGLLNDNACTIHWGKMAALSETFRELAVSVVPPVSPDTRLLGLGSDELPWGAHAER